MSWMPTIALGSAENQVAKSRLPPQVSDTMSWSYAANAFPFRSGFIQYASADAVSPLSIQAASAASGFCRDAAAQSDSPVQALIASEVDSWLLPSAKGEKPD